MGDNPKPAYNLLDEPWLPVRFLDGQVRDIGLLEAFDRIDAIAALAEPSPPDLVAQHRLLLAIAQRALVRSLAAWKDRERALWYREGFPVAAVRDYLEQWRERFWLFHSEQPFMQVAALAGAQETCDKFKPWTQISLASANGNTPVVFDHSCDDSPVPIEPARALRMLLGFLQFTPGGLVKTLRDSDKAGPLANTAAVIPVGATLGRTLLLALHAPSRLSEEDLPSWEQAPPTIAQLQGPPTQATGPNDRYTRLSRAVLLQRESDGRIRRLRFAVGLALEDDAHAPDTMASYRSGSNDHLVRLSFQEGRVFWRDLPALLPQDQARASHPAAVIGLAANLNSSLRPRPAVQPLLVAGLASDQAKLLRWRVEQIVLPEALLEDAAKASQLRDLVVEAEEVFGHLRQTATNMLADCLPDSRSKDTRARARELFDRSATAALFFSHAERSLAGAMALLADDCFDAAQNAWRDALQQAAAQGWTLVQRSTGASAAALRAEALHWPRFRGGLRHWQPETETATEAKEASE